MGAFLTLLCFASIWVVAMLAAAVALSVVGHSVIP